MPASPHLHHREKNWDKEELEREATEAAAALLCKGGKKKIRSLVKGCWQKHTKKENRSALNEKKSMKEISFLHY